MNRTIENGLKELKNSLKLKEMKKKEKELDLKF